MRKYEGWIGLGGTLVVNIILGFIPGFVFLVWAIQWFYIIPIVIVASLMKHTRLVQGMVIAGGITILLNTALCGYVLSHFPS